MANLGNCRICFSPSRDRIDSLVKKHIPITDISKLYYKEFDIKPGSMYEKIRQHVIRKHPPRIIITENKDTVVSGGFEGYAEKLLKRGMEDDMFEGKKVSHTNIQGAQKILIEKAKLKTQQDALKLAMVKFMRGNVELVEEAIDVRPRTIPENTD